MVRETSLSSGVKNCYSREAKRVVYSREAKRVVYSREAKGRGPWVVYAGGPWVVYAGGPWWVCSPGTMVGM